MSTIRNALADLNSMIDQLESNVAVQEEKAIKQHEMFEKTAANGNGGGIDPALLAQKLDVTIEQVEELLREG